LQEYEKVPAVVVLVVRTLVLVALVRWMVVMDVPVSSVRFILPSEELRSQMNCLDLVTLLGRLAEHTILKVL